MEFRLKACPKRHGDLEAKPDITGPYVECMQCGGELAPREQAALVRRGYVPEGMTPMPAPQVILEGRRHSAYPGERRRGPDDEHTAQRSGALRTAPFSGPNLAERRYQSPA